VILGARALADGEQAITWTAHVPEGIGVDPLNGTLQARPGTDATVPLQIEAGRAPGSHLVTFRLVASAGASLPDVALDVLVVPAA
jgi:hypothetical protein